MTTLREAAQQALEALEFSTLDAFMLAPISPGRESTIKAITALRAALAEPVQEPVALDWLHKWANQDDGEPETQWHEGYEAARRVVQIHLTAPPQRKPLTDDEIADAANSVKWSKQYHVDFARAIERAHGIGDSDD